MRFLMLLSLFVSAFAMQSKTDFEDADGIVGLLEDSISSDRVANNLWTKLEKFMGSTHPGYLSAQRRVKALLEKLPANLQVHYDVQIGERARSLYKAAKEASDVESMLEVAAKYPGTRAAGDAFLWLGTWNLDRCRYRYASLYLQQAIKYRPESAKIWLKLVIAEYDPSRPSPLYQKALVKLEGQGLAQKSIPFSACHRKTARDREHQEILEALARGYPKRRNDQHMEVLLSPNTAVALEPTQSNWRSISIGNESACSLHEDKPFCWPEAEWPKENLFPPQSVRFREMAVEKFGTTVWGLDNDGRIHGWGDPNGVRFFEKWPTQAGFKGLSAASGVVCALLEQKAHCWSKPFLKNRFGNRSLAEFPKLEGLSIGAWVACGQILGLPRCIGLDVIEAQAVKNDVFGFKHLRNVIQISAGATHACAVLEGNRPVCWGLNLDGAVQIPKGLEKNVTQISAGFQKTCVLQNGRPVCWGNHGRDRAPAHLRGCTEISTHSEWSCAICEKRPVCWDRQGLVKTELQPKKPKLPFFQDLDLYPKALTP